MSKVVRVYSEKMPAFAVKAKELKEEINSYLNINTDLNVRVLIRYDIENITEATYKKALVTVFSEPPVDYVYEEDFTHNDNEHVFGVEYLPGQFDQRADSAVQCVKLLKEDEDPVIKTAVIYVIEGDITEEEFDRIKNFCINLVDSREAAIEKPDTLVTVFPEPEDVIVFDGFIGLGGIEGVRVDRCTAVCKIHGRVADIRCCRPARLDNTAAHHMTGRINDVMLATVNGELRRVIPTRDKNSRGICINVFKLQVYIRRAVSENSISHNA